jgi:diketogulonate reductase-like aldo/keto reductase
MTVPAITLNNGVSIPQVGLGVFEVPDEGTQANVEKALELGYRHVDTAAAYYNEVGVGAGLRASGLPREDVFVTTKVRNGDQGFDHALRAFEDSRRELGVDYVDLYLIHWPVPSKGLYVETWRAFEKLLSEGAVRAIGVSNFLPEHLDRLVAETDVVPAVNQIEVHPRFQQAAVQERCREHGIVVEAYSPLGRGAGLEAPGVVCLAAPVGVSPAQVVLRLAVEEGIFGLPK